MPNTTARSSGSGAISKRRIDARYGLLIRRFPLRTIHSEAELDAAHDVLRELHLRASGKLTSGEEDYLDVLLLLVREYERAQHAFGAEKDPQTILRFLVRESGMTVSELGKIVGSQPQASMLLNGTRQPSKEQIVRLADHFRVSPELFLPQLPEPRKRSA